MPQLTLTLFGPPQVELDGVPLHLDHRKPVALLTYLALTRTMHTRDALAALLWPDYANARTYLRNNLWIIRKALGAQWADWLHIDRNSVAVHTHAPLWIDVVVFQQQMDAVHSHHHASGQLCPSCLARLQAGVALYTADFLYGFTLRDAPGFDQWVYLESERLRREMADALDSLVTYYSQHEEFHTALGHAQRWVIFDPPHEAAHQHLMRLYERMGQRAAALRQYETCTKILQQTLDAAPSPETEALYAQIYGLSSKQ